MSSTKKPKAQLDRDTLQRQIDDFLAGGGSITEIAKGESGKDRPEGGRKHIQLSNTDK
ncbi:Uncharacterised protein [BD1-7 clade bacterium]|uniref:Transcriptional regulator SutA RNAP-binding domain-containing protein n=1 Tax=BD1-7 clade bacterium TaxID=2029982 RepID=A0A5S9QQF3_9GAMM|nr:Uncharacterised protein [BD1-7 clade bacterium]CAA0121593.1 Uncharacterised protein [BD1-7 clade bacterium]CAA0124499.1 Uncharacterised protein [BD1-7 clade bacterium]